MSSLFYFVGIFWAAGSLFNFCILVGYWERYSTTFLDKCLLSRQMKYGSVGLDKKLFLKYWVAFCLVFYSWYWLYIQLTDWKDFYE